jgi:RNA polymerase sigma-70 factor (ECF subfamily)
MTVPTIPSQLDIPAQLGVLRRYALVLAREAGEAEDLVQEALVRAIASAHTWQPGRPVRPWLLAILHNVHVSRRRRRQVEAAARGELAETLPAATPPPQPGQVELGDTLRALMTLPEEQREVLVLVAIEGLAYKEAAELLEIPVGTLMSRLGRARAALRAATGAAGTGAQGEAVARPPALRVVR